MKTGKQQIKLSTTTTPPAPPPHPPVVSIYTDRILTFDAFQAFIRNRLGEDSASYTLRQHCIGRPGERLATADIVWDSGALRVETLRPHHTFFEALWQDWSVPHGAIGNGGIRREHCEATWRIFRHILRFFSNPTLHTPNERIPPTALQRLDYLDKLLREHSIFPHPIHFLHVSPDNPKRVRFYDEKALERDIPIETTIAKYVRRFWPNTSDETMRAITDLHKRSYSDESIEFVTSLEDMKRVYKTSISSCMAYDDFKYGSHVYPLAVYADMPGIKLAAIRSDDNKDTYCARAFVYEASPTDKRIIRVYGDSILQTRLERIGYKQGNWTGARLKKIPALQVDGTPLPKTWVMPYIDDTGRNNGDPVQWVSSTPDQDYWSASTQGQAIGGHNYNAINITGLVGKYFKYSRQRARWWSHLIAGIELAGPYDHHTPSTIDEWMCRLCNEIYDGIYVAPYRQSSDQACEYRICPTCQESHVAKRSIFRFKNDDRVRFLHRQCVAVLPHNRNSVALVGDAIATDHDFIHDPTAATIIPLEELVSHGYVRLNAKYYGRQVWVKQNDDVVQCNETWCYVKDMVTTVFGATEHRKAVWFLGQNFAEEMQFFPKDGVLIQKEFKLGRFFVVGNKIAYDPAGIFRPIERRELFSRLDECEEDETDDIPFDVVTRVPLVEYLSILAAEAARLQLGIQPWANRTGRNDERIQQQMLQRIMSLLPRVQIEFFLAVVPTFMQLNSDLFSGLDGISSLAAQMHDLYVQLAAPPGKAFGGKTPKVPTPPPVLQRPEQFSDFLNTSPTSYYTATVA